MEELIKKYVPQFHYHPKEKYFPVHVNDYLKACLLRDNNGIISDNLSNEFMETLDYDNLQNLTLVPKDGKQNLIFKKEFDPTVPTYVNVYEENGKIYINYIINFAYNTGKDFKVKAIDWHYSDIEHMTLEFNKDHNLLRLYYASHGREDGIWKNSSDVQFEGYHPIVYVTEGTHGFYPEPKVYNRMFGFGNDITAKGGIRHIPAPVIFKSTLEEVSVSESTSKINWITLYNGKMADGRISSFIKKPWLESNAGNKGTKSPPGYDHVMYYTTNIIIFIVILLIIYITGILKLGLTIFTIGSYVYLRGSIDDLIKMISH